MAQIIPNLILHLMNDADVFAAFGNRITGKDVPDGQAYPYAYLWTVTGGQQYGHHGESGRIPMVQCDVIDDNEIDVDTCTELIRKSLSGFHGQLGQMNVGYVFVNVSEAPKEPDQVAFRNILEITVATNE